MYSTVRVGLLQVLNRSRVRHFRDDTVAQLLELFDIRRLLNDLHEVFVGGCERVLLGVSRKLFAVRQPVVQSQIDKIWITQIADSRP